MSLLRRGYFSSSVNVLTSVPKVWDVNNREFFQLNWVGIDHWIEKMCCDGDFNSDSARLPCCLSKRPLKLDFLDIYLITFLEVVISGEKNLLGSSFSSKYWEFNLDFKNSAKNSEKFFCFWDNIIWIGIVKLSILRRGYFSSAGNVLRSHPKIWDVNNRDFFQLNWLASDQLIGKRCCEPDFNSPWARLPCGLSKGSVKRGFLDIYLTTFLGVP